MKGRLEIIKRKKRNKEKNVNKKNIRMIDIN